MREEPEYRYAIEIFWSEEDDCFIACVPDLENCAAWGMTYKQALKGVVRDLEAFMKDIPRPRPL